MSIKWYFPSTGGGRKSGLNDGNIETFKDNPYKSLAREICQNSLDAAKKGKVAIVEFSTFTIDSKDFPDVERNAVVKVIVTSKNSITITTEAVALSEGNIGDTINLQNKKMKKIYTGKIIGENKVLVQI